MPELPLRGDWRVVCSLSGQSARIFATSAADVISHRPDPADDLPELVFGHAQQLRPVTHFIILVNVDAPDPGRPAW